MTQLPVSVVIVSRGRPDALSLCLTGCMQLHYDPFEIVVVADPAGVAAAEALPFAKQIKIIGFDEANISAARNVGISAAAGDIVAFVDDDAVPEPTWLTHLTQAMQQGGVVVAGGYVRGRNGISYQWKGRTLNATGETMDLPVSGLDPVVVQPTSERAAKTEGTNMAVRRDVLVELGGFDPAYHYFLDETDLNMRLAKAGHACAIVPRAQVHHGFAANKLRRADRVPTDLFDIGASWAVFQRKFIPREKRLDHWRAIRKSERGRAIRLMVSGHIEPHAVTTLIARLDQGYGQGISRGLGDGFVADVPNAPFKRIAPLTKAPTYIATRSFGAAKARTDAVRRVKDNQVVTLIILTHTALYHQACFHPDGYWEQCGGLFGKSDRNQSALRPWRFAKRFSAEVSRIAAIRGGAV
ncbi:MULTISPECIES: glycosyltransferase family 2 protein [Roseobacteraceae]|uniref:Putative glycosyl transferase n=1 Tax=Pseudosulfitobacter pseudonitzschiae TaxID=1402135 RepID=A0A221K4S9_9RHOB|nr:MULTISPECIES: glycosyltransferase [Roseobacteraceae]ASM73873.1 putative glycosyl transferase [Pseudosulfitobacter pseudonitzschiae]